MVTTFREQILRVKGRTTFPMVVCGNMSDREDGREVSTAEGKELARSFGVPFFETSALNSTNVEEAFFQLGKLSARALLFQVLTIPSVREMRAERSSKGLHK